jgi:hypothetical protein
MKDGFYFYLDKIIQLKKGYLSKNYYFLLFYPTSDECYDIYSKVEDFCKKYNFKLAGGWTYDLGNTSNTFSVNILDGKNAAIAMKEKIEHLELVQLSMVI